MSTCFGATCLSMDDLYNFVKGIKDLDLYGYAHTKCCNGNEIGQDCECDDDDQDTSKLCMFDYCWTWTDLWGRL